MRPWSLLLLVLTGCAPELPKDEPDQDSGDSDEPPLPETDDPVDTAPEPPCARPEVEPNDTPADAEELPTEVVACGAFQVEADADRWRFVLAEPAWLALDVRAQAIGSPADVSLLLDGPEAGLAMAVGSWMDRPDVHLLLPVPAGTYDAVVRQAIGGDVVRGSGPDWTYELRASTTKPPFEAEVAEDPTLPQGQAQPFVGEPTGPEGLTVLGRFDAEGDTDHYTLAVPEGRHVVRLTTRAHALGSPANVALRVKDPEGATVALGVNGWLGWEPDAVLELHTDAAVSWTVEVLEEGGHGGPGWWYAVQAAVEVE